MPARSPRTCRILERSIAAVLLLSLPVPLASAVVSWTGAAGTNWATGTSWSNGSGPGTTDTASFTDTGASSLPGDLTSTVNIDRTIGGLAFGNSSGKYHTLDLGTHTLTVTGILSFNLDKSSTSTTTIRDGTLTVNSPFANVYVGAAVSLSATGIANLSGLSAFNVTAQSFQTGTSTAGNAAGTITLAPVNNITTALMQVGAVSNGSDSTGTLHLGLNNTVIATQLDVGRNNAVGAVDILSGGTLNLGTALQPTSFSIGVGNLGSNNTYSGRVDLTGATVNMYLSQLIVGQKDGGGGPGDPGSQNGTLIGGNAGSITIGSVAAPGNWYVGYTMNGGDSLGNVDFSHMTTLQAYLGDLFVGKALSGNAAGNVALPATSTISATNSIVVGSGVGGQTSTLTLGLATALLTNQFTIGQGFSTGKVTIPAGAVFNLGSAAQPASLSVGITTLASNDSYTGTLDLTGANVNAYVGQFIVAQKDGGSGPGDPGQENGNVIGGNAGSITIGSLAARASWYVGYTINGGIAQGTVNLSHMNTLQAYVNDFIVGKALTGSATGNVSLPGTNVIDAANSIVVGAGVGSGTSSLALGTSNTILTPLLIIAQDSSSGSVSIPSGGALTLGSLAQRANLSIAVSGASTGNTYSGMLDLTNASLSAYLDSVIIGNKTSPNGSELATFTISNNPNNYIDANTITLGGNQSTGTLNYGGGIFFAGSIAKGAGTATFNWTGGKLSVGSFGVPAMLFSLANSGTGTLAPGSAATPIGTSNIYGNYTQGAAAAMAIDIAGVSPGTGNDLVAVTGSASLAGTLALNITGGFVPTVGQNLVIATYGSHAGAFGFVAPPSLPQNVAFQLDYSSSPTQLFVHFVAPTSQTWSSAAAVGTFGTAGNWNTSSTPITTSALTITNSGTSAQTVSVLASTTVHRIFLQGNTATATLEVPAGIQLGVANQLVVGSNGILSGGGQIFGNVLLSGGTLASFGTVAGNVFAAGGPSTIAPSATLGAGGHGTLVASTLTTSSNTTLAFNLGSPGTSSTDDHLNVTAPNGLTLNGGILAITNSSSGPASLGYYKAIQYAGTFGGSVGSLAVPAIVNNISYTLDAARDPGFIDIHKGFLGDANDDGVVNAIDLGILATNFNSTDGNWSTGDYNGDGIVNAIDLGILATNFNGVVGSSAFESDLRAYPELQAALLSTPSAVPEPGTLGLLGLAAAGLLVRRKTV